MRINLKTLLVLYPQYIWGFCILFFLDSVTKILAQYFLQEGSGIEIISHFFSLQLAFNTGVAFSFPLPYFLQIFSGVVLLVGILYWGVYYFEDIAMSERWGITLLLAGASSNLWERIIDGHVTDFLFFYHDIYYTFSFPIFNIADIAIFVGVVLCLWGGSVLQKSGKNNSKIIVQ